MADHNRGDMGPVEEMSTRQAGPGQSCDRGGGAGVRGERDDLNRCSGPVAMSAGVALAGATRGSRRDRPLLPCGAGERAPAAARTRASSASSPHRPRRTRGSSARPRGRGRERSPAGSSRTEADASLSCAGSCAAKRGDSAARGSPRRRAPPPLAGERGRWSASSPCRRDSGTAVPRPRSSRFQRRRTAVASRERTTTRSFRPLPWIFTVPSAGARSASARRLPTSSETRSAVL